MPFTFDFRDQLRGPWETASGFLVQQFEQLYAQLALLSPLQGVTQPYTASATLTTDASGTPAWTTGSSSGGSSMGALTLLKANNGTSTAATATTVDTIAISGLTSKDTVWIVLNADAASQPTASVQLYQVESAVGLTTAITIAASEVLGGQAFLRQAQHTIVQIHGLRMWSGSTTAAALLPLATNVSQNWTASWTLGLRHGGVTAGGTFRYSWVVYKAAGQ